MTKPYGNEPAGLCHNKTIWSLPCGHPGCYLKVVQVSFLLILTAPAQVMSIHLGRETTDLRISQPAKMASMQQMGRIQTDTRRIESDTAEARRRSVSSHSKRDTTDRHRLVLLLESTPAHCFGDSVPGL